MLHTLVGSVGNFIYHSTNSFKGVSNLFPLLSIFRIFAPIYLLNIVSTCPFNRCPRLVPRDNAGYRLSNIQKKNPSGFGSRIFTPNHRVIFRILPNPSPLPYGQTKALAGHKITNYSRSRLDASFVLMR